MKISLKWINDYVDIPDMPDNLQAFCDKLDLTGTGVEVIEKLGSNFDNIVTGQIVSKEKHPNSDHMWVTKVDVGSCNKNTEGINKPLQIVCGAQNFNVNDKVVVALIGAVIQGKFKIKKSKLRGIESFGMNCSKEELGLETKSDGIYILEDDAPIGIPVADYLGLSDIILDTEITPNRPDCLSVMGCAREIAAIYNVDFKNPLYDMANLVDKCNILNLNDNKKNSNKLSMPTVNIKDDNRCQRYIARLICGVKVGPSPSWLVERINAMGARSINNIVDITNYILYLFGQPLHAFDYDTLKDTNNNVNIIVRPAHDNEKFTTLDKEDRVLNEDMTVIANSDKSIALAGVMGGLETEVTDNTVNILLETATFSSSHTSRTSRKLGLISESSMRYERRVDDSNINIISDIACALITEVAGGSIASLSDSLNDSYVDVWPVQTKPYTLNFRIDRFNKMMGADIEKDFIKQTLQNLGCKINNLNNSTIEVITPTFRPDLEREIDLYEEVLRIYGMDKIDSSLPKSSKRVGKKSDEQIFNCKVNNIMVSSGIYETMSYSFSDKEDIENIGGSSKSLLLDKPIELLNPMNAQQKYMRQSLIPGLLHNVSFNLNHGVSNIKLYETGKVFYKKEGRQLPKEVEKIACVLCGSQYDASWNLANYSFDFYDIKGIVENLISSLNIKKARYKVLDSENCFHLQPGRAASIEVKGSVLGWLGQIHPNIAKKFDIDLDVVAFELDYNLLKKLSNEFNGLEEIPTYPSINIDIALIVDKKITNETIMQRLQSAGGQVLKKVKLFDVYTDDKHIGTNKKSMAYSLEYCDYNKTLKRHDVEKIHNKLVDKICKSLNVEIR